MVYIGAVTVLLSAIHAATATGYKGRGEWTYTSNGIGACGNVRSDGDLTVSLSRSLFDKSITDGNPNHAENCGRCIQILSPASFQVTVADRCEGCAEDSLTFTPAGFALLDDFNKGHVDIEWDWCNSTMLDASQENPSLIDPVMTLDDPILVAPVEANFETPPLITVASIAIDHLYTDYTDYAAPSSSFSTTTTTATKTTPYIKKKCHPKTTSSRSLRRKKCHPKTKHSKTRRTSSYTHFATPSISSTVTATFGTSYVYQETATQTSLAQSTTTTTGSYTDSMSATSAESCRSVSETTTQVSSTTTTMNSETTRCHETTSTTTTTSTHTCGSETQTLETTTPPTTTTSPPTTTYESQTSTDCSTVTTSTTTTLSSSGSSLATTTTTSSCISSKDEPLSSSTTSSTVSTPSTPVTLPEPSEIAGITCTTFKDSVCSQNVLYECLGSDNVYRWYVVASC
ncbi:hypothetical protein CcCBS67573_g04592 [Chytriomyces confervae]|uniref:Expansin-like EG45 domain-containing protein n=1 Tax=Chytriomyces confervae TaxID=246404 RepID=A0A507FCS0_9FUNG|nr:hypothetical protein CcCBS67573_g04592 [Chytriomyces confervae]